MKLLFPGYHNSAHLSLESVGGDAKQPTRVDNFLKQKEQRYLQVYHCDSNFKEKFEFCSDGAHTGFCQCFLEAVAQAYCQKGSFPYNKLKINFLEFVW